MSNIEEKFIKKYLKNNSSYGSLWDRVKMNPQIKEWSPSSIPGANLQAHQLYYHGGFSQQNRMIKDKRKSLDKAVLYSYQGAFVKKYIPEDFEVMEGVREQPPVRALINPNKLKQDYDDKIISIGFEHEFKCGDVFEWIGTKSHWLIYLQDLTELAYFRGDIRKCSYEIAWQDEDGVKRSTYAAIRGPVETKINFIQKHGISVDTPNYSLNILLPKNSHTLKQFQRYSKFYLNNIADDDNKICWRVEAIDSISMPGILEINAVEYYANETEDDIENGIVGGLIVEKTEPEVTSNIKGETFIKPKKEYEYTYEGVFAGSWNIDSKIPVSWTVVSDNKIKLKWNASYSGQFEIQRGNDKKTIVVESLF